MAAEKFKAESLEIKVVKVSDSSQLDELGGNVNYEASGDGTLMVDTDALENAGHHLCDKIRAAVGKYYTGLVWVILE
jgi:hypothetical protein